jgi:hypothetical protein
VDFKTVVAPALDANLAGLYKALDAVGSNTLPIVNKALKDLPGVRDAIDPAVRAKLKAALVSLGTTASRVAVTDAILSALGTGGLNVIGDRDGSKVVDEKDVPVAFPTDTSVDVRFDLAKSTVVSGDFGLGLPGIPLQTDALPGGGVQLAVGFAYKDFHFGVRDGAFFFNTDAPNELTVTVGATLKDGPPLTGRIGFLEMTAEDGAQDPADPTKTVKAKRTAFTGTLTIDVTGGTTGVGLGTPALTAAADVYLKLAARLGGSGSALVTFPSVYADF